VLKGRAKQKREFDEREDLNKLALVLAGGTKYD
jgi:hypothetical protein